MRSKLAIITMSVVVMFSGCGSSDDDSGDCVYGQDQTCNSDDAVSAIHGVCTVDNECECVDGFVNDPTTGKCKIPDCTVGQDQTCNNDPTISSIHGICETEGTCTCGDGFDLVAETGKCN